MSPLCPRLSDSLSLLDDIRFASYRAAAKLRCLQRQTYLYHIDIWNMIEAFRERGLHGMDSSARLTENKVRALLASLYGDLQKRLPPSASGPPPLSSSSTQQAAAASSVTPTSSTPSFLQAKEDLLFSFLWRALRSSPHSDRLRVRTLKAALAALCTGKLMDKLRYLFSQVREKRLSSIVLTILLWALDFLHQVEHIFYLFSSLQTQLIL